MPLKRNTPAVISDGFLDKVINVTPKSAVKSEHAVLKVCRYNSSRTVLRIFYTNAKFDLVISWKIRKKILSVDPLHNGKKQVGLKILIMVPGHHIYTKNKS